MAPNQSMLVYIGSPTASTIHALPSQAMTKLQRCFNERGINFILDNSVSNTIFLIRNTMVQRAVRSKADILLFIDSDQTFSPESVMKLIESDRPVTALAYRKKKEIEEYCCLVESGDDGRPVVDDGWVEVSAAGTGMMAIKMEAIEKMNKAHAHRLYRTDNGGDRIALFEYELINGKYWGEDYNFCRRWRDLGGKIWLWPDADIGHVGYSSHPGNFHHFLMRPGHVTTSEYNGSNIRGWMATDELEWLYQEAKKYETIHEVGSWMGKSTHALCSGCEGSVTAIDTFEGSVGESYHEALGGDVFEQFTQNMAGFSNLKTWKTDSLSAAGAVESTDMVFIDAAHDYESVRADIAAWYPKTKRLICGHDYSDSWIGVKNAVNSMFRRVERVGTIWYVRKDRQ